MAITRLEDMFQAEVFTGYVTRESMERSAFFQGGIIEWSEEMDRLASGPNTLVQMPYLMDLDGASETMNDTGNLTPGKLSSSLEVARKLARTGSWSATGLSAMLSSADPMQAVADRVADWWSREMQMMLVSSVAGIFGAESMAGKTLDISAKTGDSALFSAEAFIDANQIMGDAKDSLTAVAMHSAAEAFLAKQQLIDYETNASSGVRVPVYMGKRVIVDDGLPFDAASKKISMVLFGDGAFVMGNGIHGRVPEIELSRNPLASSGEDLLVTRRVMILHPVGMSWQEESVEKQFPSNSELANSDNWKRSADEKAIRMVRLTCKIK